MTFFYSAPLALVRISAYGILLVLHLVLIALAGTWYEPSRQGGDGIWAITVIMIMLFASLSFITILVFVFILHRISSIHQELIWLFLITATWAGLLAAFYSDYLNMTRSWGFCTPVGETANCRKLKLVLAFIITNTAFTLACFVVTVAFGVVQQVRGRERVWSAPMVESSAPEDLAKPVRMRSDVSDV